METIIMFFFNLPTPVHLFLLFFYFSFILLIRSIHTLFFKRISPRSCADDGHEIDINEKEEEEKEEEEEDHGFTTVECTKKEGLGDGSQGDCYEDDLGFITIECSNKGYLVADIVCGGQSLLFLPTSSPKNLVLEDKDGRGVQQLKHDEPLKNVVEEKLQVDQDEICVTTSAPKDSKEQDSMAKYEEQCHNIDKMIVKKSFVEDQNFFIFVPPKLERNLKSQENNGQESFRDSFTIDSTSRSSSEWRSSMNHRKSGSEDPFSSSSRRSCPTWEASTLFEQYDEETFYDQMSTQKLDEPKLCRPSEGCPRSFSKRIVHKLRSKSKRSSTKRSSEFGINPYHELEIAYVAQICSTWDALNLNYKNFKRLRVLQLGEDPGFPANIAQQYQQFQVLLQRFIENEPYEHGKRPEVYAKIRLSSQKLLQVPEFKESDDDQREEGLNTKISSIKFLIIMDDVIQTFMKFLKAEREKHHQIFTDLIRRKHQTTSTDPTLLHMLKKANKRKKMKLKDMRRARKCSRKIRLKEEEMEILMGLVDLKVVSRILKMSEISEEQLQWCEEKMSRVRFWEGKLQRDSTPLSFPAN